MRHQDLLSTCLCSEPPVVFSLWSFATLSGLTKVLLPCAMTNSVLSISTSWWQTWCNHNRLEWNRIQVSQSKHFFPNGGLRYQTIWYFFRLFLNHGMNPVKVGLGLDWCNCLFRLTSSNPKPKFQEQFELLGVQRVHTCPPTLNSMSQIEGAPRGPGCTPGLHNVEVKKLAQLLRLTLKSDLGRWALFLLMKDNGVADRWSIAAEPSFGSGTWVDSGLNGSP